MKLLLTVLIGMAALLVSCTAPATPALTLAPSTVPPSLVPTTRSTDAPTAAPAATNTALPPTAAPIDTQVPTAEPSPTIAAKPTASIVYMTYKDFEIVPMEVTLKVGTKVVFVIKSDSKMFHQPYTFNQKDPFESPAGLGDGTSFAHTFNVAGTITLHCGYHDNMSAKVNVTP
jgi:plastocyanin